MPAIKQIYATQADQYETLVQLEDYQGNILTQINAIRPLQGLDVVELGAGTGRLSCLMAPYVNSLCLFDASPHMLAVAIEKLKKQGWQHWQAQVADHLSLPVEDACADLAISG
jgi:ubiquinone/menaquinone biosynthesis C-methylase UbiE